MSVPLSKKVADDLLTRVAEGEFSIGDRLPTADELMQHYRVGRSTVREAIQELRGLGMVEVRPRLGTRLVAVASPSPMARSAINRILSEGSLDDLYDARLVLEPAAAARAAINRTEADLRAMRHALVDFHDAVERGENPFRADLAFHHAIGAACGNAVLAEFMNPTGTALEEARQATGMLPDAVALAELEHEAIFVAITERNFGAAETAMATHIKSGIRAIERLRADAVPKQR